MAKKKTVKVVLVKSPIGILPKHKLCLKGLGLRRMRQSVEVEDTPAVRGMINKVNYMLAIEGES
ncbi:50S ribosomal protein L30 [Gammaproteobacteria bacterium]|jgi:large subunit ribosomal protein L30|uniref:Large ribosomal subunit protein uL30 n=1 Tax=OM182 bacterium MED-G28 TaxID=1986256 RepID=A0A2A5WAJ2_9GAMM|nr:50S ribosomal protein L30 [Gammaproteobacteria bacterium]MDC0220197.1 50S ribosomal protein L30 [Gammaproteobacteria bacterium]MDG2250569.1 50S ribosomal protein L30 [Gammaproteobacteria bacterium]PDH33499.1 MAG: 50S ribosomal protein L30 [OM182 bacterium MED-G28]|tara:strand:+ start:1155 stop:1346 length:192 start_codon:yes stop_codon:yes gene_type:complete